MTTLVVQLLLLASAVKGFSYYVERNSGVGLCATNERQFQRIDIFPVTDLGSVDLKDVEEESWINYWQHKNIAIEMDETNGLHLDYTTLVTNGSNVFKQINWRHNVQLFVLADEVTFIITENDSWQGSEGFRLFLDQIDPNDDRWRTSSVELCTQLGNPRENCNKLAWKAHDTLFHEAGRWLGLTLHNNRSGTSLHIKKNEKKILQWNSNLNSYNVFVRTHGKPGIFKIPLRTMVKPTQAKNRLSRFFNGGEHCFVIKWLAETSNSAGTYSVTKNGTEVQRGILPIWNFISEIQVQPDSDAFKLNINVRRNIQHIGVCPGLNSKFIDEAEIYRELLPLSNHIEMEIFSPASGCTLFEQPNKNSIPSGSLHQAQLNATVSVELSRKDLSRICTTLGFEDHGRKEKVKFCSAWGCVFEYCPPQNHSGLNPTEGTY